MLKSILTIGFLGLAIYGAISGKGPALAVGTVCSLLVFFSTDRWNPFED